MQLDANEFVFNYKEQKEFRFRFMSDLHADDYFHDSVVCKKRLKEAIDNNYRIFIGGDTFSIIVHSDKKRYRKGEDTRKSSALHNENIEFAIEYFKPFVNFIDMICIGNHECSAIDYNHLDPMPFVIRELNLLRDKKLDPIYYGGYRGFTRLKFQYGKDHATRCVEIFRYHGSGGSAPITKGMIDIARIRAEFFADLYWLQHKHTGILDPHIKTFKLRSGNTQVKEVKQYAFYTPGYMKTFTQLDNKEYSDGYTKGYTPTFSDRFSTGSSRGCVDAVISPNNNSGDCNVQIIPIRD